MLDYIYHTTLNYLKSHFWREKVNIAARGLSNLLHVVVSLPDAKSCDKHQ